MKCSKLQEIRMDKTFREVKKATQLISLPDVYLRLKSVIDAPEFTMDEVAEIISQDPALTIRLLRMVNSSLYGFVGKIETVSRAITLLGTQQIHDLVLATSVAQAFRGMSIQVMDMSRYWGQSVYCAVTCRQLADLHPNCDKETLFVAGLLHDIGHLIMYQVIPDLSQQAIIAARERGQPLYEIERDLFGFDYSKVGSDLMQQWSLPERLRVTTRYHTEPNRAEKYPLETALVHIGSLLTKAYEGKKEFNQGALTVDPASWLVTGLSPQVCISLTEPIENDAREVLKLISPYG